jgi:lipopolysaccharide cholinephosphotransferase
MVLTAGKKWGVAVGVLVFLFLLIVVILAALPFKLSDTDALQLYQLMKDVDELLRQRGVSYVVESGTLLGCVRHQGIIPWDDDLDIQILKQDEEAFLATRPFFQRLGYDIRQTGFGYRIQPHLAKNLTFPFCDVFITSFGSDGLSHNKNHSFKKCTFKDSEYFPIKRYKFGEFEVNGPAQGERFLDRCYGASWRDTYYKEINHRILFIVLPIRLKMKPEHYKCLMPTGPVTDRVTPAITGVM